LKKKLFTVTLAALTTLSLAGCQPIDDFKEGLKEGIHRANTKLKPKHVTKEVYEKTVSTKSQELYDELVKVLQKFQTTTAIDQKLLNWLYDEADKMEKLSNEVIALEPPKEYQEVDQVYEDSMKEFQIFTKGFREGLDKRDIHSINKYSKNAQKGEQLLNRANNLLSQTYDRPIGDGTITTEDLRVLDSGAGIDRDSVVNNISEGGKEFIGKWGFKKDDVSFNISLVLNADGSYEGYGNGTYPDKSNALIGTWKYDFLAHTLNITNEYKYVNGVKQAANRKTLTMDVQYFKDGEVHMLDTESFDEFRYQKEGTVK
jgi:hypothetical protein